MARYNGKLHVKSDTGYDDIDLESKAEIISYNNSGTNFSSNNVQDALNEVDNSIGAFKFREVKSLPSTPDPNTIYIILNQ